MKYQYFLKGTSVKSDGDGEKVRKIYPILMSVYTLTQSLKFFIGSL